MAGKVKFAVLQNFAIYFVLFSLLSTMRGVGADDEDEDEDGPVSILGRYQLKSSENFDDYLKLLGVNWALRQVANIAKPILELTEDNNKMYTMKLISSGKTTSISFKLGETFDEETLDGRNCKSKVVLQGQTTLVHTQKCGDKEYKLVREFTADGMVGTTDFEGVHVRRVYSRLGEGDEGEGDGGEGGEDGRAASFLDVDGVEGRSYGNYGGRGWRLVLAQKPLSHLL